MGLCIIQWNAMSFYAHGPHFNNLLASLPKLPDVLCIQETWFQYPKISNIRGYSQPFLCNRSDGTHRGGCAIYVREGIQVRKLDINCTHQLVALEFFYNNSSFIILNMYSPEQTLQLDSLFAFLNSITSPIFLCGDFDSHHTLWGSTHNDSKGRALVDFLDNNNLVLLNDGSGTRICRNGNLSPLDLTFASPSISRKCAWTVLSDECNSDHFPVMTQIDTNTPINTFTSSPRWMLKKAKWDHYSRSLTSLTPEVITNDIEQSYSHLIKVILDSANIAIPKTRPHKGKLAQPYWNDDCETAFRDRNRARNKCQHTRLPRDYNEYKKRKAILQRTVTKAKRSFWQKYIQIVNKDSSLGKLWNTAKKLDNKFIRSSSSPLLDPSSNKFLASPVEKANLFGETFSNISSDTNFSSTFQTKKALFEEAHADAFQPNNNTNVIKFSLFFE